LSKNFINPRINADLDVTIPGEMFVKLSLEELAALANEPGCPGCGGAFEEHPDESYRVSGKAVCSDCYFAAAGEVLAKAPGIYSC
jgi:hypothetical protein